VFSYPPPDGNVRFGLSKTRIPAYSLKTARRVL